MFLKIYRYINVLSLDIVLGACINSWLISRLLSLDIPISSVSGLAICVWLIYTADHLIDAYKIKHKAHTGRHLFHQQFFTSILACLILIFILGVINALFLPPKTQFWGIVISLIVLPYLIFIAGFKIKLGNIKELIIAAIYASAIFMVPVSLYTGSWHSHLLLAFFQFFFLAFLNLMIFSFFDLYADQKDGHKSLARWLGKNRSHIVICCTIFLLYSSFLLAAKFLDLNNVIIYTEIIYFLMTSVLFLIYWNKSNFLYNEKYRLVGDMVFLFPVVVIFFL